MLAVVEAVECEALASEYKCDSSDENVDENIPTPIESLSISINKSIRPVAPSCGLSSLPTISDELKKRWSQSLNTVRRPNHENTKVYPKIIQFFCFIC